MAESVSLRTGRYGEEFEWQSRVQRTSKDKYNQLIDVRLRQPAFLRRRDDLLHVARHGLAGGAIGSNVDMGLGLSATRNVDFHENLSAYALHHALVPIEGALVYLRSFLDELQE